MGKQLKDKNGNAIYPIVKNTDLVNASGQQFNASEVSVSNTGTSEDKVKYITINGVEKKLAGGQADWNATSGDSQILNKPLLANVATSGSYNDLSNKPTIGSGILTIQKNGTDVDTFDANAITNKSINLVIPTTAADIGALPSNTTYVSTVNGASGAITGLATQDFVNSSIATNTAYFLGTLDVVSDLGLSYGATTTAIATALDSHTFVSKTNNDYVFVINKDTDNNVIYQRFKYNGSNFLYEYALNNSSFTANQWASINSGITTSKVSQYDGYASGKQDTLTQYIRSINGSTGIQDLTNVITSENISTTGQQFQVNATTLENHPASYFATATALNDKQNTIQYDSLSGSSGTLSSSDLAKLQASDDNKIICDNEIYILQDKQSAYLTYSHTSEDTSNNFYIKCIAITISTKGWVKSSKDLNKRIIAISGLYTQQTANTLEYSGLSVTIPAGKRYSIIGSVSYNQTAPRKVAFLNKTTASTPSLYCYNSNDLVNMNLGSLSVSFSGITANESTFYLWVASNGTSQNGCNIDGWYSD